MKNLVIEEGVRSVSPLLEPSNFVVNVDELVAEIKPSMPLYILHLDVLKENARKFKASFPGEVMYATKCNPVKEVVQTLYRNGIKSFDVASIGEVKLVRKYAPKAKLYFMHPVKSSEAISEAYFSYGVKSFVLDTQAELHKILRATRFADDLDLFVRMAPPKNDSAQIDFASKFGATFDVAVDLLLKARSVSVNLGVCFHVGTQTMDTSAYRRAMKLASEIIQKSGVKVDMLDIGGGFPASYADQSPRDLSEYMQEISDSLKDYGLEDLYLLSEPGRALVASGSSMVVRVEQRRGNVLYINDGIYGGLFDAGPQLKTRYPVRLIRDGNRKAHLATNAFSFAGPTCDSLDMMEGPFYLPDDIREGDWIEIASTGAYSACFRGNFNGLGGSMTVSLDSRKNKV